MPRPGPHRTDPIIRRIVVWHVVATLLLLTAAAVLPRHFPGMQATWSGLLSAQTDGVMLYVALGTASWRSRLLMFAVGIACYVSVSCVWLWIRYGMLDIYDPDATTVASQLLGAVTRNILWFVPQWAAIASLRPFLGVIRKASPLSSPFSSKLTLRRVFLWTALAALMLTSVRVISQSPGYEGYLAGVLASCVFGGLTTVSLFFAAFASRRRWIGFLVWLLATATLFTIWGMQLAQQGDWYDGILLDWVGTSAVGLAITYATYWPLRRAGYRLTKP